MKSKEHSDSLSVGEVAKRSGVAISALHFYENKGLISSTRNSSNQRMYARSVLRLISVIKVAQSLGLTLQEIQDALKVLPRGRAPSVGEWRKLSRAWKEQLNNRIKKMRRLRDSLESCIGCGCLSMQSCPLRNFEDRLGKKGTGPQLL